MNNVPRLPQRQDNLWAHERQIQHIIIFEQQRSGMSTNRKFPREAEKLNTRETSTPIRIPDNIMHLHQRQDDLWEKNRFSKPSSASQRKLWKSTPNEENTNIVRTYSRHIPIHRVRSSRSRSKHRHLGPRTTCTSRWGALADSSPQRLLNIL